MNAAPNRRRFGILLIWCGSVAMVMAGAFTLAWWKLPEWKPRWVIDHSPFVEPTVRAMLVHGGHQEGDIEQRALDWGAAIGPVLRQRFAIGTELERWRIMSIARSLVKEVKELKDVTAIQDVFRRRSDGSLLSEADAVELRDHLRGLARDACASGGDYPWLARDIMVAVYEPDFGPALWKLAAKRLGQYDLTFETDGIAHVRDPRAVGALMPLFVSSQDEYDRLCLGVAMRESLAENQMAEVVAAMRHESPHVRIWGIHSTWAVEPYAEARALLPALMTDPDLNVRKEALDAALYHPLTPELLTGFLACLRDSEATIRAMSLKDAIARKIPPEFRVEVFARLDDPEPGIRVKVIDAIGALRIQEGGAPLLDRLTQEPEPSLRVSIIEALGRLGHGEAKPVLRELAQRPTDLVRGAAITALVTLRDPADFPLLLTLLSDEDDDIARKARIALGFLPLTPGQQKVVDALWETRSYDDEPARRPAPVVTSPP